MPVYQSTHADEKEERFEPYPLPDPFTWVVLDLSSEVEMGDFQVLINENYLEDPAGWSRFDYSLDFLRWAIQSPREGARGILGVRVKTSGKLVACITGVPATMKINSTAEPIEAAQINFLCVHKKLRNKRLTPVLVKELMRRGRPLGVFHAIYTAAPELPNPRISTAKCWRRILNFKRLFDLELLGIPPRSTLAQQVRLHRLPEKPSLGMIPMETRHVEAVHALLQARLALVECRQIFTIEEVTHLLLPRKDLVYTFVREIKDKVTDFFSFYSLPTSMLKIPGDVKVQTAYFYYSACTSVSETVLAQEFMIHCRDLGFDMIRTTDVLDRSKWLDELRFTCGDHNLHYYTFNCVPTLLDKSQVGLMLV